MAHMRHDPTTTQKGKITYNPNIVSGIVALAINEVEGVSLLNSKNKGVKLSFEKQGIVADKIGRASCRERVLDRG